MLRFLPIVAGVAVVVASAIDSGRQSDRWGKPQDLLRTAERVQQVKAQLGDWQSEPRQLDARQLEVAGVVDYISRVYLNRKTGERIQVLLICGRPGPISVHEPTVCYTSAGYRQAHDVEKIAIGDNEFNAGLFLKGGADPDTLRIFWAWSTDGQFQAPDKPRLTFGRGSSALFKLYVIRQARHDDGSAAKDPAVVFLDAFLPELRRCLAPNP